MGNVWMIRAGRRCSVVEEFQEQNCVAIGWRQLPDLTGVDSREQVRALVDQAYPGKRPGWLRVSAGQVARFLFDIEIGDSVLTYESDRREYLVGEVTGKYAYQVDRVPDHPHTRTVKWIERINRDDLSVNARNSLGAIQALFSVNDSVWREISLLVSGEKPHQEQDTDETEVETVFQEQVDRAHEFIKDRAQALEWDEMQELVAGILRAMGYKTVVSPKGSDRGKDIVASPDGLGLEQPRIRVEVKHRPREQMGASQIRSFIGALRQNDRGLYVSTGGFSKEAHYEAERSNVPLTLVDLDVLVSLLVQHYDSVDMDTRTLVPLTCVYWPAS